MTFEPHLPTELDSESTMRALRRARRHAYELAARTGTLIVLYKDGKVVDVDPHELLKRIAKEGER